MSRELNALHGNFQFSINNFVVDFCRVQWSLHPLRFPRYRGTETAKQASLMALAAPIMSLRSMIFVATRDSLNEFSLSSRCSKNSQFYLLVPVLSGGLAGVVLEEPEEE